MEIKPEESILLLVEDDRDGELVPKHQFVFGLRAVSIEHHLSWSQLLLDHGLALIDEVLLLHRSLDFG